jgi:pimeloyl-ACP methyl ester carboxylesterase
MGMLHHAFEHLDEVRCPVTIGAGEVDGFGPAAAAPSIVAALPHGTLDEPPDLGHFGPLEDPARLARHVLAAIG